MSVLLQLSQLLSHILQMPVYSIALLTSAGILVGYALTASLRREEPTIEQGIKDLHAQNLELQETLRGQKDAYARLERRHVEQHDEWVKLRGLHDRVEAALKTHHLDQVSLEEGLSTLTEIRHRALRDMETERQLRLAAEEQSQIATRREQRAREELAEALESQAAMRQQRDQLVAASSATDQMLHELARVRQDHEALLQALHSANRHAEGGIDATQGWSATAAASLLTRLESQVKQHDQMMEILRQERQEALIRMENERLQREALEKIIKERESTHGLLGNVNQDLIGLQENLSAAKTDLLEMRDQVELLTSERDSMLVTMQQNQQLVQALQVDLDSHRRALDTIERQRDDARQQLAKLSAQPAAAELSLDLQQRFRELKLEYGTAQQQITEFQQQVAEYHQGIRRAEIEVDRLRSQRDEILSDLRAEQEERKAQSTILDQQVRKLHQVSSELKLLQDSQEELVRLRQQVVELQSQVRPRAAEPAAVQPAEEQPGSPIYRHDLEHTVAELRQQLREAQLAARDTYERRVSDARTTSVATPTLRAAASPNLLPDPRLPRGRDHAPTGILARLRQQSGALESIQHEEPLSVEIADAAEDQRSANGQWHLDPNLGVIYTQPPSQIDFLTQIDGISAVIARSLNELGIYSFRQIMEWDSAKIAAFSARLGLDGEIQHDDWVGQARRLCQPLSSHQAA
jgi:predicted flap endonuclease-1-like 5' DNA nuclease